MMKRIGFILILLSLLMLCLGFVSASENNTVTSLDDTTHLDEINNQALENDNDELVSNEMEVSSHEVSQNRSNVIYVEGNTFEDIQNAINSASENDTLVLNGTYFGNGSQIIVNKSLTITSDNGNCIIDANELSRCFYIAADNVVLKDISITNAIGHQVFTVDSIPVFDDYVGYFNGGAIYWDGDNGIMKNCNVYDNCLENPFLGKAIYWNGSNGLITNSSFYSNMYKSDFYVVYFKYDCPCVAGSIHGYYEGDIWSDCYFRNVSLNAKANLTFDKIVVYNNCLVFNVIDEHNLPYINETIKIHIYDNRGYDDSFEVKTNSSGSAKLELPLTLTTGKYNIEFNVKIIHSVIASSNNLSLEDWKTNYSDVLIGNSSLSVVRSSAYLKSNGLITYYNSGKYLTVKLVDSKSNPIKYSKIRFNIYYKNSLIKTCCRNTNNNGICYLPINLNTGNYKVVISSINSNYNVKALTKIVKITKAPTIIKTQNIVKKNKLMKIQILNKDKKPVNNMQLRIKIFTGKIYKTINTKTNNKGLAAINTKNLKAGNYKIQITTKNPNYFINRITTLKITP